LAERAHLALAVAAVFALHPLQTQAVVYVSQRAESMASAFYIGALLLLLEAERRGRTRGGITLYILAFVCHVLGLGTKSIVLTVPFAYLLMGVLPARTEDKSPLARPILRLALSVPFAGYSAFVGFQSVPALRNSVQGLIVAGFDIPSLSPWHYFLTEWEVIVTYLRLLFWPAGQNLDWNFPVAHGLGDPSVSLCGLLLTALLLGSGYVLYRYRARGDGTGSVGRAAAFGVCWFFLVLSPSSSIFPILDPLMEHRLYLASMGIFLAIVVLVDHAIGRLQHAREQLVSGTLLLVVVAVLATLTYSRAGVWRTRLRLWADVCAKSPDGARAHANLAGAYHSAGMIQPATDEYLRALKLAANDPIWYRSRIRERLAAIYLAQGRLEDSIAMARAGLVEYPDHTALLGTLALAYLQHHDLQEARAAAEKSVRTASVEKTTTTPAGKPAASMLILGLVRAQTGDSMGAIALFEQALKLEPELLQARWYLAEAYRAQGRTQEACEVLRVLRNSAGEQPQSVKDAMVACPSE
jgi:tetratricopeptide (TPR) repeat protein